jgi:hypothetical protein
LGHAGISTDDLQVLGRVVQKTQIPEPPLPQVVWSLVQAQAFFARSASSKDVYPQLEICNSGNAT